MSDLTISTFTGLTDTIPKPQRLSWEKLAVLLTTHRERAAKEGRLWSPVTYRDAAARGNDGVATVCALVLDFDTGIAPGPLLPTWEPYEYLISSTFSHRPDYPRWRAVFPLAAPVAGADWPAVYRKLTAALGGGHPDPACKDAARMYYTPACPPGADRFGSRHAGVRLDPAAFPDPEPAAPPPEKTAAPAGTGNYATLDVIAWFQAHGAYGGQRDGEKHTVVCPWEADHTEQKARPGADTDTVVWEGDGEKLWPQFHCRHGHCAGRGIREVMAHWGDADRFCSEEFAASRRFSLARREAAPARMTLAAARLLVQELYPRLKAEPQCAFAAEPIYAFALLRLHDRTGAWTLAKRAFGDAKIGIREIERALPPVELADEDQPPADAPRGLKAGDFLPDCPAPGLIIPEGYLISECLLGRRVPDQFGNLHVATIAFAPVLLTGRTYNPVTGDESLRLSWGWRREGWKHRIVERGALLDGKKLLLLANSGFPVADDSRQALVAYLNRLEAANRETLPTARVSAHLGWQGRPQAPETPFLVGRALVRPDGSTQAAAPLDAEHPDTWTEQRIFFHALGEGEEQLVDAFTPAGTWAGWLAAVAPLQDYPRALLGLYASFCAPLLSVLGVSNFIVDFANPTSTGKSTILHVAGSVWGNPDERTPCSVVHTWDATRVWTERVSQVINGLPLIMDDTKKAKNRQVVADLIYAITSGRGRGRGKPGGMAETAAWRTVMLSSGEQPATSYTQDGGTRMRSLEIRGAPFGASSADLGLLIQELNRAVFAHYGHAGPRFMAYVMEHRDEWEDWAEQYRAWQEWYARNPPIPEASRLAEYAALVTVTEELVHQALGLPWEATNVVKGFWVELAAEAGNAVGERRALEDVISWAHSNERSFYERFGSTSPEPTRLLGRWPREAGWEWLAFFPKALRDFLTEAGYHADSILGAWKEKGWLRGQQSGDGRTTCAIRIPTGELARMVVLTREAVDSVNGSPVEEAGEIDWSE